MSSRISLIPNQVIGIAGADAKCRWVEKLGADVCINYKSPSFKVDLTRETEGFVEVYFGLFLLHAHTTVQTSILTAYLLDNVGGEILDFMLTRLAKYGRVAAR